MGRGYNMALDPNIPLIPSAELDFQSPLLIAQGLNKLRAQRQELEQAPLMQRMLQERVNALTQANQLEQQLNPLLLQAQQAQTEMLQTQSFAERQQARQSQAFQLAQEVKPDLDAGNITSAKNKTKQQITALRQARLPTQDQEQFLKLLENNQFDQARQLANTVIERFRPAEKPIKLGETERLVTPTGREIVGAVPPKAKPGEKLKIQRDLRTDFTKGAKPFMESKQSFGRIEAVFDATDPKVVSDFTKRVKANVSPEFKGKVKAFGDLALIFNFMKILDPGSTVREGEFANAQNTAGVQTRFRNLYNQVLNGARLEDDQRQAIRLQAESQFNASKEQHKRFVKEQIRFAKQNDADTTFIPREDLELLAEEEPPLTPEEEQELQQLRQQVGGLNANP